LWGYVSVGPGYSRQFVADVRGVIHVDSAALRVMSAIPPIATIHPAHAGIIRMPDKKDQHDET